MYDDGERVVNWSRLNVNMKTCIELCTNYTNTYIHIVKVFNSLTYIKTSKTLSPTLLHLYRTLCLATVFTRKARGEKTFTFSPRWNVYNTFIHRIIIRRTRHYHFFVFIRIHRITSQNPLFLWTNTLFLRSFSVPKISLKYIGVM
jgi:hypothetical protein